MSERLFALPFVGCATRVCLAGFALVLLPLFVIPAPTAEAGGSTHPYFNDRGTLKWHVRYADARRTALREGDDPLGTVAERFGYRSEAAFCRAFKREFGTSPGSDRRVVPTPLSA